jgi:Na+/pantothenate symporter
MFVIRIVRRGSFTSLSISLVQMLVELNGFDFESIESSFFWYLDMAFGS